MSAVSSKQANAHASRLRGQVVVLTGAGSGIGKEVALTFAKHGAKMVLGDVNEGPLKELVQRIQKEGGEACWRRCDVTIWEDQVALFELAKSKYSAVDVVLPNAGVSEMGSFDLEQGPDGKLTLPTFKTYDIDLTAVLYTSLLAMHHFAPSSSPTKSLRALVLTASMSTFFGAKPSAVLYSVAKAGVMGLMNGLDDEARQRGVRTAMVAPYFVRTPLLPDDFQVDERLGFAEIADVVDAFLIATTDPDASTSGSGYAIPDSKGVWRMAYKQLWPKGFSGMGKVDRSGGRGPAKL